MNLKRHWNSICLVLSLCLPACVHAQAVVDDAPPSGLAVGLGWITKGNALADSGKTTEAEIAYQQAMEALLPGLRGLPFKHTVKRDVTPREKIRDYLQKELEEEMTPEERRAEELTLKALGLIPSSMDYMETMLKVYTEEIGAFYDPRTDTMHLILEEGPGRKPGLLEALLGRKAGFDKDETRMVIAHELTHALADQHYDLDVLMKSFKNDDDRELALATLIEGEATLVMMGAMMDDWSGQATAMLPAEQLGRTFTLLAPLLRVAGGQSMRSAPPIIGESMLFPYLRGLVFCAKLTNEGGWKALDEAYAKPPLSTEQILHPEKYGPNGDAPMAIDLGTLEPGEGWRELTRNVLGELQISVMLRGHDGRKAAAGWDGDQFASFEHQDGALGYVLASTWDSENDAQEFAASLARYQKQRHGGAEQRSDTRFVLDKDGVYFVVEQRGTDVVAAEGFSEEATARLVEQAFRAECREKTHEPRPK